MLDDGIYIQKEGFHRWFFTKLTRKERSKLLEMVPVIEKYCRRKRLLRRDFFELSSSLIVDEIRKQIEVGHSILFAYSDTRSRALSFLDYYEDYLKEKEIRQVGINTTIPCKTSSWQEFESQQSNHFICYDDYLSFLKQWSEQHQNGLLYEFYDVDPNTYADISSLDIGYCIHVRQALICFRCKTLRDILLLSPKLLFLLPGFGAASIYDLLKKTADLLTNELATDQQNNKCFEFSSFFVSADDIRSVNRREIEHKLAARNKLDCLPDLMDTINELTPETVADIINHPRGYLDFVSALQSFSLDINVHIFLREFGSIQNFVG